MAKTFLTGIDLANQKAKNVAAGTDPNDAVNLAQMQAFMAGLSWHGSVRAASAAPVTLATPGSNLDNVALVNGNRILLKNQGTPSENGVYIWTAAGTPLQRAPDGVQGKLLAGAAFYVEEGNINADTAWTLATDNPITVGTTNLTFNKFGAGNSYTFGDGLTTTNGGLSVALDWAKVARHVATNIGDGASLNYTFPHNLASLDVIVQVFANANGETVEVDVIRPTANSVNIAFAAAPAANAYRVVVVG